MSGITLHHSDTPSPDAKTFLDEGFQHYAQETTGDSRTPFCLTLRTDDGALAGVLKGYSYSRDLYIKQLLIAPAYRGYGHGATLMDAALELGRKRGCAQVWVDTLSYQAPDFYLKAGFAEHTRIAGYRGPHDRIFYCRAL